MWRSLFRRPLWTAFLLLLYLFGAVFTLSVIRGAVRHAHQDVRVVFHDAPLNIVPPAHSWQVKIVKSRVPQGAVLFYIMQDPESWQSRLWERSLFPDNYVIFLDAKQLNGPVYRQLRQEYLVRDAIFAGQAPPLNAFNWTEALPSYPGSIPLVFGELKDDAETR